MLRTLKLSFALKNSCRVNSILYALKQIPGLRKALPDRLYQNRQLKLLAQILSVLAEIVRIFIGKILYFAIMVVGALSLYRLAPEQAAPGVLHLVLFLTIPGTIANTQLFNPAKERYYAILLLGMNAREYTLVHYAYFLLKMAVGLLCSSLFFCLPLGLSAIDCGVLSLYVVGAKAAVASRRLKNYERHGRVPNENNLGRPEWLGIVLFLAASYVPLLFGVSVPKELSLALMLLTVGLGLLSVPGILTFSSYRALYKELYANAITIFDSSMLRKVQQQANEKLISADVHIQSRKTGLAYLNDLFIQRHRKILWKSAWRITAGVLVLFAGGLTALLFYPQLRDGIRAYLLNHLPAAVFLMYTINRGQGFARALFYNCDHSMLTYSFYKQPEAILALFRLRLREIIKINLLPALAVGAGLDALLLAAGATVQLWDYAVVLLSVIGLSIFFSVHYLVLYYLLQPYTVGTEMKSGLYFLFHVLTYGCCYGSIYLKMPLLFFCGGITLFCLAYYFVASALVFHYAPRTFRLRF